MSGIERVCISVSSICNLKCTYCYFFLEPDRLPGFNTLSAEEIRLILGNIHKYSLRPEADKRIKINFVGSGEPLLSWTEIRTAIETLEQSIPDHGLRFYTVTNALLVTEAIAREMKAVRISPSVSLDGPAWLNDRTRITHQGRGSHAGVMRGLEILRAADIPVAINTTLTRDVITNLDVYFDFIEAERFDKIIFGRLVDVPEHLAVSTDEFYLALRRIAEIKEQRGLEHVEIGNLESYRRAVAGTPDRVCTMFGSTCGSGFHNIIYMQRDVYPCGRMFGQDRWNLGRFDQPLESFTQRMSELVGDRGCGAQPSSTEGAAGPDCLIEREGPAYDPSSRNGFVEWFRLRETASARARDR